MVLHFLKSGLQTLHKALSKSRAHLTQKMKQLFSGSINEETLDELERLLYESDLGVKTAGQLVEKTRNFLKENKEATSQQIIGFIQKELEKSFENLSHTIRTNPDSSMPTVILVVGANGNGKTTSCAKLAYWFKQNEKKPLLAAADTFRAGAQEQLKTWAERIEIDCVMGTYTSDPAAVVFDACTAAKARGIDVLIIDTAGRLENKTHLMKELEKIRRSCEKTIPGAPHETLFVLDATIGQNGLDQAKSFHSATPISGIILTKMDGSAKGGIALSIQKELQVPIKFLGLGEKVSDFTNFSSENFLKALFGDEEP